MAKEHRYTIFPTRHGFVALAWSTGGVTGLRLPSASEVSADHALLKRFAAAERAEPPARIAALVSDVIAYFDGKPVDFTETPVDLGPQSLFFSDVYQAVRKLGWGETTTYGSVAQALGADRQAAREVGAAMASNPVPLIVPCHRVLAAGGKVGGFSAPGGSLSKARMLELEGVGAAKPTPKTADPRQIPFDF